MNLALVSINEREEMTAQKEFYEKIRFEMVERKSKKMAFLKKILLTYNPIMTLTFVIIYWVVGLKHT